MIRRPVNAADRLAVRQSFIPKAARPILEHTNGSAWYSYESNGKLLGISFWGTSAKPHSHYSYRSEDQRNQAIQQFRLSVEHSVEYRAKRKTDRGGTPCALKVGDIVHTSWGYDQTNVDMYIVTRRTDACVWVRPIAQDSETTGFMCGKCWPKMPIEMTGPETRHVITYGHISINGHGASLTTGDTYFSSYA